MTSQLKIPTLEDEFKSLVDTLRETGTIDSASLVGGVLTIQSSNALNEGDIVVIESQDYKVFNVSPTQFDVKSSGILSGTWKAKAPYFMDGHLLDVKNRLIQKDESTGVLKWQKYPLIILLQDFEYSESRIVRSEVSVDIIIVNETKSDYDTEERRENNFKPVLDPIYNDLMNAFNRSRYFSLTDGTWDVTRRYYWGSELNNQNIFTDHLDAIEINNLSLTIPKNC